MNEAQRYEQIERYLLNRMPEAERAAFEAELAADPALAGQLASQRKDHELLERLVENKLRGKLVRLEQEARRRTQEKGAAGLRIVRRRWLWAVAAGLALVTLVVAVLNIPRPAGPEMAKSPTGPPPDSPQTSLTELPPAAIDSPAPVAPAPAARPDKPSDRYIALADTYTGNIVFSDAVLRGAAPDQQRYQKALELLEAGRYRAGIDSLLLIPNEPGAPYWPAQYAIGLAYLKQGQARQAIPFLQTIARQKTNLLADDAAWHLALAQLRMGDRAACDRQLDQILADSLHPHYTRAVALQKDLPVN